MDAKDPEKKIPSTAAKATRRSAKVTFGSAVQLIAQLAFLATHGSVWMALKRKFRS